VVVKLLTYYRFHELSLVVQQDGSEPGRELVQLLDELSWVRNDTDVAKPLLSLSVHQQAQGCRIPLTAQRMFQAEGFHGFEHGEDFYLTEGASCWHLQLRQRRGEAWLAPNFAEQSPRLRRSFWAFGVLKLLRPLGWFSLHAAAVISPAGQAILIVGAPGSGKSTLALGLWRQGWGYVSDDALLLRLQQDGVEAVACRRDAYVDADAAAQYADLAWGAEVPDGAGGWKRRIHLGAADLERLVPRCKPQLVLFSRIVPASQSALRPLERASALRHLLGQSAPQLFDRQTMAAQLTVLTHLVQQASANELHAGRDLYQQPLRLVDLLAEAEGAA
jgi:hypothetical protein